VVLGSRKEVLESKATHFPAPHVGRTIQPPTEKGRVGYVGFIVDRRYTPPLVRGLVLITPERLQLTFESLEELACELIERKLEPVERSSELLAFAWFAPLPPLIMTSIVEQMAIEAHCLQYLSEH